MLDFRLTCKSGSIWPRRGTDRAGETAGRVAHVAAQFGAARGSYGTAREAWQPGGSGRSPKSSTRACDQEVQRRQGQQPGS